MPGLIIRYRGCNGCLRSSLRGLWSLIPVLVAFPLILCQQPPVTDRLPRHSIRISSNRGLYCILLCRFRCAFPGASAPA